MSWGRPHRPKTQGRQTPQTQKSAAILGNTHSCCAEKRPKSSDSDHNTLICCTPNNQPILCTRQLEGHSGNVSWPSKEIWDTTTPIPATSKRGLCPCSLSYVHRRMRSWSWETLCAVLQLLLKPQIKMQQQKLDLDQHLTRHTQETVWVQREHSTRTFIKGLCDCPGLCCLWGASLRSHGGMWVADVGGAFKQADIHAREPVCRKH